MTSALQNVSVVAKIYFGSAKLALTIDSAWSLSEFYQNIKKVCRCNFEDSLTVKWLDDEEDPCTISSKIELDEAIRYVINSKHMELLGWSLENQLYQKYLYWGLSQIGLKNRQQNV